METQSRQSFSCPINQKEKNKKIITERKMEAVGEPAQIDEIQVNMRVYHDKFGYGIVNQLVGDGADKKAIVHFDTVGPKTLMLKFAKLIIPK